MRKKRFEIISPVCIPVTSFLPGRDKSASIRMARRTGEDFCHGMLLSGFPRLSIFSHRALGLAMLLPIFSSMAFADFTVSAPSTTAQTLASGQTGTVTSTGTLTVSGGTVAVTVTGNNATLTNSGTISQTGTGRIIRDNTGVTGLIVTNNAGAMMQTADADVIQMNKSPASVTLNNYGTMTSLNASKGGSQAVDFNAIASGSNIINNYSTGILQAVDADAVRPGVNGVVNNYGLIKATNTTDTGDDGIDAQTNSGVTIHNFSSGTIEAARHGITGGNTSGSGSYAMSITNVAGGTIKGNDGSGVNIDGINKNELVTINNAGLITGNGVTGDGDGVDVDGLVNLTNSGTIRSVNSFSSTSVAQSEGVTVGGGTIVNSGMIEGDVAAGNGNAIGRGITIAGIDTSGTPEPIYANTTITNSGLIRGQTDSGIAVLGAASGFTVTINNASSGIIRGGGATAAAIQTGADNDTVNNAGQIIADSSGKAIDLGGGDDALTITGGVANIFGDISGGTGTNTLVIDPGAGNSFSYSGTISNFSSAEIKSGTVKLFGSSIYTGSTLVSGGTLFARNLSGSATGTGDVLVKNMGVLAGDGRFGGNVSLEAGALITPGDGVGTLKIGGNLNLVNASRFLFDLGANSGSSDLLSIDGQLNFTGSGNALIDFNNNGVTPGKYTLMDFAGSSGLDLSKFMIGSHDGFSGNLVLDGTSLSLVVTAIPEPATTAVLFGLIGFSSALGLRAKKRKCTT